MKKSKAAIILLCIFIFSAISVVIVESWQKNRSDREKYVDTGVPRIVSLAPSITETLFMLNLGDYVVGVSRYCSFPPAVTNIPAVGGLGDLNVEAIIRLNPTHVIGPAPQRDAAETLKEFGIEIIIVDIKNLHEVLQSIFTIADEFNRSEEADEWLQLIDKLSAGIAENRPEIPPRVLICTARDPDSLDRIYIAGKDEFYTDILELAGGANAYTGQLSMPMITPEGILKMNPDMIIDIVTDQGDNVAAILTKWSTLPSLKAVRDGNVHIITEEWAVRPGPRIGFLMERIAEYVQ